MADKRPIQLPDRRVSRCEKITLPSGHVFFLHCGFDVDGVVREIFVDASKVGSDLLDLLHEQCIQISYRLQYGPRLAEIETRSTMMATLLARAQVIEREEAAAVIAEYAAAGQVPA
jgi:hypothetical protein